MIRGRGAALATLVVAGLMVTSAFALPLLGGGGAPFDGDEATSEGDGLAVDGDGAAAIDETDVETGSAGATDAGDDLELVSMEPTSANASVDAEVDGGAEDADSTDAAASIVQDQDPDHADAVEDGVDEGIELAQSQGVEVSQEQRAAAIEGASQSVVQHQDAEIEQVQEATKGAVHGAVMQEQDVAVEQIQFAVGGATDGALAQHQTVTASQMQSATWGATHGAIAQHQRVTVEQIQVATRGAAAGAAHEAGEKDVDRQPKIQEAAQGAAYGVIEQYQKITVEQRQRVTLEHVQHAAAGASAGALEGSTEAALEQDQRVDVEQHQRVDIKQVQKAATGAGKGALVQRQEVTVEQTQSAARGAGKGPLKQVQTVDVEQVQRVSITQIQEAAFGGAKGSIYQSQAATVEQIQYAADGASGGVLVQQQEVSISQIQHAAVGAAHGGVTAAVQEQVVEVEQIQAASFGAGEGAVLQKQIVDVTQVQQLATGGASGALVQHQEATIEQIQYAASGACQETARAVQYQRISVTQLQTLTFDAASDATAFAVAEGIDDPVEITQRIEIEMEQRIEEIDELEGEASLTFAEQDSDGESVTIDSVNLSEGGFVAIYEGDAVADPAAVLGASDYLEPGEHDEVAVDLEEAVESDQPLLAVVHHDTTDDETFQYAETDGAEDEPYVTPAGSPVVDTAFVAIEEPEPEATLTVSDQEGDGETLVVDEASADVDFTVTADAADGEAVAESEQFEADETQTDLDLELEPLLEANETVNVAVVDDEGEELASEAIEYTVEDEVEEDVVDSADEAEGMLAVTSYEIDVDDDSPGEEFVVLQNTGETAVDLSGWTLQDRLDDGAVDEGDASPLTFDENVTLEPGEWVTIVTGPGDDTDETLFWGLEEPVWDPDGDVVTVRDGDGDVALEQRIAADPEATLNVSDQEGDGETLVVDEASADVDFTVTADAADAETIAESEQFEADETQTVLELELEPPLEENETVDVAVVDGTGEELENESVEYTVEDEIDEDVVDSADEAEGMLAVTDYEIDVGEENAGDEYVTIENTGDDPIDFTEWTLQDRFEDGVVDSLGWEPLTFPDGFVLEPGADVTIVTGPGDDTDDTLHWGHDSPVWNETGDEVVVLDSDDEVALQESIAADDPPATLNVSDQTGDGETLSVDEASADADFRLAVTDEDGEQRAESELFEGGETVEFEALDLEPPLEEDATLEVSVVDEAGEELATESLEYTVDPEPEAFEATFVDCQQAEVTGSFDEGDTITVATGFYESGGFGNTMGEYAITVGDELEAPFEGTITYETGAEFDVEETADGDDDGATVTAPEGDFGAAITGFASPDATPGSIDHPNPDASECIAEVRPELPDIEVAETEPTDDDGIDVTFGYENPNDAPLVVDSSFVEGTTDDEPVDELAPGSDTFTVEWTPETDDERLVWAVDMTGYDYDEVLTAETETAGEIDPTDPAAFDVEITGTNAPVEQGEPLEVDADIENVGGDDGTQDVEFALGGEPVDSEELTLEPDATESVTLTAATDGLEPGEYTAAVATENDTAETTVEIEAPGEPEFTVTDLEAPESGEAGEEVSVSATIENVGEAEGTQTVGYDVDGQLLGQETVTLEAGSSMTVTFSTTLPETTATHTVTTDDDEASATIEVTEPAVAEEQEQEQEQEDETPEGPPTEDDPFEEPPGEGPPGEGDGPPGEGPPGEGDGPPGEGPPGEGDGPPGEGPPGEGDGPPGEGPPGEGDGPPGEGPPGEGEGPSVEGEGTPGEGEGPPDDVPADDEPAGDDPFGNALPGD